MKHPKGIALILCDLKKINHRIKCMQWFGVSFCIGFTFAKTALPVCWIVRIGAACAVGYFFFGIL
jgi:hypothetical protein